MARGPAVSVVIPTKDRPAMAAAAVASAAAQTGVETEILVVDDGSAPEAAARLRSLVGARAAIVRHERGEGVSRARNAGVERASAAWIAFLDDDDLWAPGKLAAQLAVAETRRAQLVSTGIVRIDAARRVLGAIPALPAGDPLPVLARRNPIATPSAVLADAALVRAAGGFEPRLSILADWDLWLSLAERGRVAGHPGLLTAYTEHAGSMSVTRQAELRAELELLHERHAGLLDRHGGLGGADLERWIAASVRRSGHPWRAARLYAGTGVRHRDPGALARAGALALGPLPLSLARGMRRRRSAPSPADVAWVAAAPRGTGAPGA